jgi:hypothetical protein
MRAARAAACAVLAAAATSTSSTSLRRATAAGARCLSTAPFALQPGPFLKRDLGK